MAQIKQAALDYERKRYLRPDWRRYWKPSHDSDPLYRLYESVECKYSPDQPRVPAGVPTGGQWTSEGGGGTGAPSSTATTGIKPSAAGSKPRTQTASRISPQLEEQCELQLRQDKFICNTVRSRACHGQAMLRYANCLRGLPIPPLVW